MKVELNHSYVNVEDLPIKNAQMRKWATFFEGLTIGKAAMFQFNNRQRAHQVRGVIVASARYYRVAIKSRIIHGSQEIHGTDDWLLYIWRA